MTTKLRGFATFALFAAYVIFVLRPAWNDVAAAKHARDYATYHYAIQEALDGGDPYDTSALGRRAREARARTSVHPFFYPPPFLLTMPWAKDLSLAQGYRAYFWINQAALAGCFLVFWAWFRVPLLAVALLLATFTPIADNARMGQANLVVLLVAALGLWRRSGLLVSFAAMCKMSPALYLAQWAAERRFRPLLVAIAGAAFWSVLALALVPAAIQIEFYGDVLPTFWTGRYHGLTVPISLPANHSLADLFNAVWPGKDAHTLSMNARVASGAAALALLATVAASTRARRDALGSALAAGAYTVVLLVTPVFTFEHHLAFVLLPGAALATALHRGLFGRGLGVLVLLSYALVAWPLPWIRTLSEAWPRASGALYETKLAGLLLIGALAVVGARRCPAEQEND